MRLLARNVGLIYWFLLFATALLAFWQLFMAQEDDTYLLSRILTAAYLTVRMFVLEDVSQASPNGIPLLLQILRIAGPALAASGMVAWAAKLIAGFYWIRLHSCAGHAIVYGLGQKGLKVALSALEQGLQVVAIEANRQSPESKAAEEQGVIVLAAASSDEANLRRARIHKCLRLYSFCHGDKNADIVTAAINVLEHSRNGSGPQSSEPYPIIYSHVSTPGLREALQRREYDLYHPDQPWVEYVNILDMCSKILESRLRLLGETGQLLLVGGSEFHKCLLERFARSWASLSPSTWIKLQVTIVGSGSPFWKEQLLRERPNLAKYLDINCFDGSPIQWQLPHREPDPHAQSGKLPAMSVAFVSEQTDDATLTSALAVEEGFRYASTLVSIYAVFSSRAGYGRLLAMADDSGSCRVETFGLLEEFCDVQVLGSTETELLAQAIHEGYLEREMAKNASHRSHYVKPWASLSEKHKEPSRASARMAIRQLSRFRLLSIPVTTTLADSFGIGLADIEDLARTEHDRWMRWMADRGYVQGPTRNDKGHPPTHPSMIPYDDLSESEKDKDRNLWRDAIGCLSRQGYRLIKAREP